MLERSLGLGADALGAIADLEARSVKADGGRLKLEWGVLGRRDPSAVNDLLWWDGGRLVGFCGRYAFGGQVAEATGMVDPAHRRRGIGAELLSGIRSLCAEHGDASVLLVAPRSCLAARSMALGSGGVFDHAEHALVLTALREGPSRHLSITLRTATESDADAVGALLLAGFGKAVPPVVSEDPLAPTLIALRDDHAIGTLRVTYDTGSRGIYGFVVEPSLQGQGIGRAILRRVCEEALDEGAASVHLEVTVDNDRALGLYTSVGFELQTTEDYYAFSVADASSGQAIDRSV